MRVRHTTPGSRRSGAAAVEGAIMLAVFLAVLFALFDLGLAVLRYNALSECARRAARAAIVRGERAPESTQLGHETWLGNGADAHILADQVRPLMVSMSPEDVQIFAIWPDGGNQVGQKIQIELTYQHESLFPRLFGESPWELRATSTMRIVH